MVCTLDWRPGGAPAPTPEVHRRLRTEYRQGLYYTPMPPCKGGCANKTVRGFITLLIRAQAAPSIDSQPVRAASKVVSISTGGPEARQRRAGLCDKPPDASEDRPQRCTGGCARSIVRGFILMPTCWSRALASLFSCQPVGLELGPLYSHANLLV